MVSQLVVPCPAKVNRYLRVGPKDPLGYHPLTTEFQAVGLFDTLIITVGGSGLQVEGMELPEDNTVSKALRLMREVATLPPIGIRLIKRIPAAAGLGGGSSDAAGLLRGLRKILPSVVPDSDFLTVARSVGADVAFFLTGGRALGEGYGDRITPLPDESPEWLVLAKPEIGCNTASMYAKLDAARAAGAFVNDILDRLENDFHRVAPAACTALMNALDRLGLRRVGLSGSGSVVYGAARSEDEARAIQEAVSGATTWIAPTLSRAESLRIEEITLPTPASQV